MGEIKSSAHSKWICEYHIVFAPKFRRKEIYGQLKTDIGQILRKLCEEKKVEILEANACPDHIHMLVSIPPHLSVAQFMGYLKGKSFRPTCKSEIQIWQQALLVQRIFCRYSRTKRTSNKELHTEPNGGGLHKRSDDTKRVR